MEPFKLLSRQGTSLDLFPGSYGLGPSDAIRETALQFFLLRGGQCLCFGLGFRGHAVPAVNGTQFANGGIRARSAIVSFGSHVACMG